MSDRFRTRPYRFERREDQGTRRLDFQAPVEEFFVVSVLAITGVCAVIIIALAQ